MVRHAISQRSHGKIGDCEQSTTSRERKFKVLFPVQRNKGVEFKILLNHRGQPLGCQGDFQPRSQVLSPTRRETLVGSGHVSPRIWEITNKQLGGGADKCEICLYKA